MFTCFHYHYRFKAFQRRCVKTCLVLKANCYNALASGGRRNGGTTKNASWRGWNSYRHVRDCLYFCFFYDPCKLNSWPNSNHCFSKHLGFACYTMVFRLATLQIMFSEQNLLGNVFDEFQKHSVLIFWQVMFCGVAKRANESHMFGEHCLPVWPKLYFRFIDY